MAVITSTVQVALANNNNGDVITRTLSSGETLAFTYTREHKVEKVYRNGSAIPEHSFTYSLKGAEAHQTQFYPEAGAVRVDGLLFYLSVIISTASASSPMQPVTS